MDEGITQHLITQAELSQEEKPFQSEDFDILSQCINKLPEKSKNLIMGRYEDEHNATTLAQKFQMTATAVRLALMRIRKQLRGCVEQQVANV